MKTPILYKVAPREIVNKLARAARKIFDGILCVDKIGSRPRGILCVGKIGSVPQDRQPRQSAIIFFDSPFWRPGRLPYSAPQLHTRAVDH